MKRSTSDPLLDEVLAGEELAELRRTTLEQGLVALRRRRRRRYALQLCAVAALPLLAGLILLMNRGPASKTPIAAVAPASAPPASPASAGAASVRVITDEELFALFPNRPMALVGKAGQQELVFLDQPNPNRQP